MDDPADRLDVTPKVGRDSVAAASLSPSSQILEKKKFVFRHFAYSQMEGAVVNYLHPFPFIRRQLGPGELWRGGNHTPLGRVD